MATTYCIIGESGTGKTTSLAKIEQFDHIGLNPKETAIINIMDKPLPFKGSRAMYGTKISAGGNYASVSDGPTILAVLAEINEKRPDIKNVIIDDFQYIMADEFMAKALKKGYDKFNEIGKNAYDVITAGKNMRQDINFICITHSDFDKEAGAYKLKTIGKMLDDKVNLAGLFTVVLFSNVEFDPTSKKAKYEFITNKQMDRMGNEIPAKSPIGMFDDITIPNDLGYVIKKADEYYNG